MRDPVTPAATDSTSPAVLCGSIFRPGAGYGCGISKRGVQHAGDREPFLRLPNVGPSGGEEAFGWIDPYSMRNERPDPEVRVTIYRNRSVIDRFLTDNGFVAILEQVAVALMTPVVSLGIAGEKAAQQGR